MTSLIFYQYIKYYQSKQLCSLNFQMKFLETFRKTLRKMDLLSTPATFRIRKEPQYETVFGGFLSFAIMCLFGYLLYSQFSDMLNNLNITYSQGMADNISSDSSISDVRFAVAIDGVDLSASTMKFVILFGQVSIAPINGTPTEVATPIALSPCQLSDWKDLGQDFITQYTALGFERMLCVSNSADMSIAGYAGSSTYEYLNFQIVMCNRTIDTRCDNTTNIDTYITNFLTNNDYFKVRFYMVDTIITPTNDQAITKVLQKNIFMAFTNTIGTVGYINLAEYNLDTDVSIFPTTSVSEITGSYIQKFQTNSVSISSTKYVNINIYKSTKSLTVSRTIGKIDVVLSYVGGLFGLLFTGIAYFLGSYSEMKYEMYVAESMLIVNENGKRLTEDDFGFFTYLVYCAYDFLDNLGIPPTWFTKFKQIHQVREESCEQLDPTIILRRIKYVEDVSKILINQHKEMCAYLTGPITLNQARLMRQTLTYYDRIIGEMGEKNQQTDKEKNIKNDNKELFSGANNIGENSNLQNSELKQSSAIMQNEKIEKQLTEEEEDRILESMMFDAVQRLQRETNQIAQRLKNKVSIKTRDLIKKIRKERSISNPSLVNYSEALQKPIVFKQNESELYFQENHPNKIVRVKRSKNNDP